MMIMFGRVYGAVIAALIFAICTAKLPFMQSIIFTVVLVLVLGVARPHILALRRRSPSARSRCSAARTRFAASGRPMPPVLETSG